MAKTTVRAKKKQQERKPTGGSRTYEALKELILSGTIPPGADLDEGDLVQRFEVSRTPVREALIRLSTQGLVTMLPNRGAKVSNLNFSDITDHLEIMDILTPSICYLAALRRTPADLEAIKYHLDRLIAAGRDEVSERLDAIFEVYTALGAASHNESLSGLFRLTLYTKLRLGWVSAARPETDALWKQHTTELQAVYHAIYEAIIRRDANTAQTVAKEWMNIIRNRLSTAVSTSVSQDLEFKMYGG
ncbi:MAG: DNA-binding GntR family transcriptional regulator [Halioglobus sp.]|jgi:DNA-binding GntR family transcriptional regulator